MKIQLTDEHCVETDSLQYILKRKTVSENGNVTESILGYYGTFEQLAKGLVEKEIKTSHAQDFERIQEHLNKVQDVITSTLHKIGVPALLAENENNFNLIKQLERKIKRLEKELKEIEG